MLVCARIARGSRFGVFSSLSEAKSALESRKAIAMINVKNAIGRFKVPSGSVAGIWQSCDYRFP